MKAISQAVEAGGPIDVEFQKHADGIVDTSKRMLALFSEGAGGDHSRAKPEIWSDWNGFVEKANDFEQAGVRLSRAMAQGDIEQVSEALKAVRATCGGCHKPYREPKGH